MRKSNCINFLITLVVSGFNYAQSPLATQLDQLLAHTADTVNIGIIVADITTGKVLYQQHANHYFTPASTQKLLTAYTALDRLGPDYVFTTQLLFDPSKIQHGVLYDNLYVKFSGDPSFTLTQLQALMANLKKASVTQIAGNIVIDDSVFKAEQASLGTSWEDSRFCYGAPANGIIIDHNCATVTIQPAPIPGQLAKLRLPAAPQFMHWVNEVQTVSQGDCDIAAESAAANTYVLTGCMRQDQPAQTLSFPIVDTRHYMQAALMYTLSQQFIRYLPQFKFDNVPANQPIYAAVVSPPLKTLVKTMLKDSNNLYANVLFKTIAQQTLHVPGSWKTGQTVMQTWLLQHLSAHFADLPFIDGSGGSRYNLLTPKQLLALLQQAYYQPFRNDFVLALPISGVDGTLMSRMQQPELIAKVYAKTGSMTGVSALAGYIFNDKRHPLAFAIMINHFFKDDKKYKDLEDQICYILVSTPLMSQ